MERGERKGLGVPALLGKAGRKMAHHDTGRNDPIDSGRTRLPREFVRGGCFRALVRRTIAYGGGMGNRFIDPAAQWQFRRERAIPRGPSGISCFRSSTGPDVW